MSPAYGQKLALNIAQSYSRFELQANDPASQARSTRLATAAAVIVVVVAAGLGLLYLTGGLGQTSTLNSTAPSSTTTARSSSPSSVASSTSSPQSSLTTSTNSTLPTPTVVLPNGTAFQVQSSFDCVAGHSVQPFNVTAASLLTGGISAGNPGVTLYVSTAQEAQTTNQGHPAMWVYTSGLVDSTSFSVALAPGSYVLWTEGGDLGCGAGIVTPLEELTTVTVTQAVTLTPS